MERRSFLHMATMLAAVHGLPGTAFAATEKSTSPPTSPSTFDISEDSPRDAVLKVVGVGRVGCNVVKHLIQDGLAGVEFVLLDGHHDRKRHRRGPSDSTNGSRHDHIECRALAGEVVDPGKRLVLASMERSMIARALEGADMVFIVAGMGGKTGSSVAPVVAKIARELEIFPVALVSKPFESESEPLCFAEEGIAKLVRYVDSAIVLPNDTLKSELGESVSIPAIYHHADNILKTAISAMVNTINITGLVGIDYVDFKTVMMEKGEGMMGFATATGVDRARLAAEQAVKSPTLGCGNLSRAYGVFVNITAGLSSLKMREVHDVMSTAKNWFKEDATVIFGTTFNDDMADELSVTVIATGIGGTIL